MVGTAQYRDEEIAWVLEMVVERKSIQETKDSYLSRFGKILNDNQIRYIKNKYGKDPKYNSPLVNSVMGRSGPSPSSRRRSRNAGSNRAPSIPPPSASAQGLQELSTSISVASQGLNYEQDPNSVQQATSHEGSLGDTHHNQSGASQSSTIISTYQGILAVANSTGTGNLIPVLESDETRFSTSTSGQTKGPASQSFSSTSKPPSFLDTVEGSNFMAAAMGNHAPFYPMLEPYSSTTGLGPAYIGGNNSFSQVSFPNNIQQHDPSLSFSFNGGGLLKYQQYPLATLPVPKSTSTLTSQPQQFPLFTTNYDGFNWPSLANREQTDSAYDSPVELVPPSALLSHIPKSTGSLLDDPDMLFAVILAAQIAAARDTPAGELGQQCQEQLFDFSGCPTSFLAQNQPAEPTHPSSTSFQTFKPEIDLTNVSHVPTSSRSSVLADFVEPYHGQINGTIQNWPMVDFDVITSRKMPLVGTIDPSLLTKTPSSLQFACPASLLHSTQEKKFNVEHD